MKWVKALQSNPEENLELAFISLETLNKDPGLQGFGTELVHPSVAPVFYLHK